MRPEPWHCNWNSFSQAFAPFPGELSATAGEARAFGSATPNGIAVVGGEATEARVRDALRDGDVVHLATHGVLNARNPMFSRIAPARSSDASPSSNDGRL